MNSTTSTTSVVDTRDMVVVHTALLRELRLAPAAVRAATPGSVRAVAAHVDLICTLLSHHHSGEDELLWPVLRPRLGPAQVALLDLAETQHADIEDALGRVVTARAAWVKRPDEGSTEGLAASLGRLHLLLADHLDTEERELLPLASLHLTQAEWDAIGEAGAAGVPKRSMLLVFGMFAYEGDPAVLAQMLRAAPPPVRVLVPRVAPRVYARHARRVHGTARP